MPKLPSGRPRGRRLLTAMLESGFLDEIFISIQGEGIFCGARQVFIRFALCNLKCAYCDTAASRELKDSFFAFQKKKLRNPVVVSEIIKQVKACRGKVHSVSLTGGEPLVQGAFAVSLARALKRSGFKVYLETNGTLEKALKKILPYTDHVAMDIKLPSTAKVNGLWKKHAGFLKAAGKKAFVKIVVGDGFSVPELRKALRLCKNIKTVIQPRFGADIPGLLKKIEKSGVLDTASDIRFVPQIHRFMGIK